MRADAQCKRHLGRGGKVLGAFCTFSCQKLCVWVAPLTVTVLLVFAIIVLIRGWIPVSTVTEFHCGKPTTSSFAMLLDKLGIVVGRLSAWDHDSWGHFVHTGYQQLVNNDASYHFIALALLEFGIRIECIAGPDAVVICRGPRNGESILTTVQLALRHQA